jgi:hypothetical protein
MSGNVETPELEDERRDQIGEALEGSGIANGSGDSIPTVPEDEP